MVLYVVLPFLARAIENTLGGQEIDFSILFESNKKKNPPLTRPQE
jgi:hypothetical protein